MFNLTNIQIGRNCTSDQELAGMWSVRNPQAGLMGVYVIGANYLGGIRKVKRAPTLRPSRVTRSSPRGHTGGRTQKADGACL